MLPHPLRTVATHCLLSLTIAAIYVAAALAQEPTSDAEPDSQAVAAAARQFQAYAKECAAAYTLHAESAEGRQLELIAEPVLRWANPLGGRKAHGDVFVWTDAGRPAAVLSLYEYTHPDGKVREHHEFCSLATTPLAGAGPSDRDWSPAVAGLAMQRLQDAPAPADSPTRRLSQMRELAGRFSGAKITREEQEKRDLRLLSKPLIRYESKTHGVTDGALFALVEATDPEILLVIEALTVKGQPQWHYGLARMNSLWLAARYQDQQVWEADVLKWGEIINRADQPYMIFGVR